MTVAQHKYYVDNFAKFNQLLAIVGQLHYIHRRALEGTPFPTEKNERLMKRFRGLVDELGMECPWCELMRESSAA